MLHQKLNDPDFYRNAPEEIKAVTGCAEKIPVRLEAACARREELTALDAG
ncbi:MAG: hypothetical protein WC959_04810 [Kiritimatiellales bacterium]